MLTESNKMHKQLYKKYSYLKYGELIARAIETDLKSQEYKRLDYIIKNYNKVSYRIDRDIEILTESYNELDNLIQVIKLDNMNCISMIKELDMVRDKIKELRRKKDSLNTEYAYAQWMLKWDRPDIRDIR